MKNYYLVFAPLFTTFLSLNATAQNYNDIQYWRTPGFEGLNIFETEKEESVRFDGFRVRLGGDFALQFQSITHSTESGDTLATLGNNFNLPTANLNLDVQLADGVRMNLVTYLSSRHHPETWVKGGNLQIDKLDFIKQDLLKGLMSVLTIRTGLDEINYGDTHFRRSDNARAIYNPFVGNYIMDAFTTEAFGELNFQYRGMLLVAGISNGKLNQSVINEDKDFPPSLYGKLGYDKQFNDDLRCRLTGSFYSSPSLDNGQYLYAGDRTGSRYYAVMQEKGTADNFRSGRFSPGFKKFNSFQINPFIQWKGLEFFGVFEFVQGDQSENVTGGNYTQLGTELIYRIGKDKRLYLGGRYNSVVGNDDDASETKAIERINAGGGWFMTDNVLMKAEYVNQNYWGSGWKGIVYESGNFNGFVLEAVIGF